MNLVKKFVQRGMFLGLLDQYFVVRLAKWWNLPHQTHFRYSTELRCYMGLLAMRALVLAGAVTRMLRHPEILSISVYGISISKIFVITVTLGFFWLVWAALLPLKLRFSEGPGFESKPQDAYFLTESMVWLQIAADSLVYGLLYLLTLKIESDFFLFFLNPVFVGSIFLNFRPIATILLPTVSLCAAVFTIRTLTFSIKDAELPNFSYSHILINVLSIRILCFAVTACFVSWLMSLMRASRDLYSDVLDHLPIMIWRKDKRGRFLFANKRLLHLLGRGMDQLLDKTDFDVFPSNFAKKFRQDDLRVLQDKKAVIDPCEAVQGADGALLTVHVTKMPIWDISGEPAGTQGFFIDFSKQQRLEMMQPTVRMQAIFSYARKIRHCIKNSVANIRLNIASLGAHLNGLGTGAPWLAQITQEVNRIWQNSDFGNIGDERLSLIGTDLSELLRDRVVQCERSFSSLKIISRVPNASSLFKIDRVKYSYAIDNLLWNACEAAESCQSRAIAEVCINLIMRENGFVITVENQNIQIEEGILKKIQAREKISTKKLSDERGFGLTYVFWCMDMHGHAFEIRNDVTMNCVRATIEAQGTKTQTTTK